MKKTASHPSKLYEITKLLTDSLVGPTKNAAYIARYVGGQGHEKRLADEKSSLVFWGHKVPVLRNAINALTKHETFRNLSEKEDFKIWRQLWDSTDIYELRSVALYNLTSKRLAAYRLKNPLEYFRLAAEIDNWAHSDELSSVISPILESDRAHISVFEKWNEHRNPWLRRQSLVGLYFYARFRTRPLPPKVALELVNNLLDDKHFYVQRGVGWTLREIDRVDSALQRRFVKANLSSISSTAWFATSELYGAEARSALAAERKLLRGKREKE